ncbi:MAG: hypothetical protein IJN49_08525 [Clostridia bacterium]|nr:hypothetical protein [Clostridia bacterium]
MKKIIAIFLLLSLLLISGCTVADSEKTPEDSVSATTKTTTEKSDENKQISLTEKYIAEIEAPYKDKLENGELSNYEVGVVSEEYSQKWRLVADEYYNKILQKPEEYLYDKGLLKSSVINMKENWDKYSEQEKEDYHNLLVSIHGGGTIVGPDTAKYKYELEKQWALKILAIAERLLLD